MDCLLRMRLKDPDGKTRIFKILDVPVQKFDRGRWVVTVTELKRETDKIVHKVEWECMK